MCIVFTLIAACRKTLVVILRAVPQHRCNRSTLETTVCEKKSSFQTRLIHVKEAFSFSSWTLFSLSSCTGLQCIFKNESCSAWRPLKKVVHDWATHHREWKKRHPHPTQQHIEVVVFNPSVFLLGASRCGNQNTMSYVIDADWHFPTAVKVK